MLNNKLLQILHEIDLNLPANRFEELFNHPVLSKTLLEFPFPPAPKIAEKIINAAQNIKFQLYPKTENAELESLIREKYCLNENQDAMICNGGMQGINLITKMISYKNGARVLLLCPDFFIFKVQCLQHQINFKEISYQNNLSLDLPNLCNEIKEYNPDLILISNPNNPLALELSNITLEKILQTAECLVLIDETYTYFGKENALPLLSIYDNLLILRSFSKIGFAAIRFAFICGHRNVVNVIKKFRDPFPVNTFTIEVAKIIIKDFSSIEKNIAKLIMLREEMINKLNEYNITVFPSSTNFIVIDLYKHNVEKIYQKLIKLNIPIKSYQNLKHVSTCLRLEVSTREINNHRIASLLECLK